MDEEDRPRKLPKLDHGENNTVSPNSATIGSSDLAGKEPESAVVQIANEPQDSSKVTIQKDTEDEIHTPANAEGAAPAMSKNQLKKLRRKERFDEKREFMKSQKKDRRIAKKENRHRMFEEARATGGEEAVEKLRETMRSTKAHHGSSTLIPLTFVMDCSYDELMNPKERISLASQLTRTYSDNSRAQYHGHLMFSSFNKLLKERFDTTLKEHKNWKQVRIIPEDFVHAAGLAKEIMSGPKGGELAGPFAEQTDAKPEDGEVIYLSSDSENTLTELKPYSTYIVGALVDKNRHKAVCYKHAVSKDIKTAKLPIGKYIKMTERSVLTTNHVVEIMLRWLEVRDWGKAFMDVLPSRKGGVLRENPDDEKAAEEIAGDSDGDADEQIHAELMKQSEEINASEKGNGDDED